MSPNIGTQASKARWKGAAKAKRHETGFMLATRRWALYRAKNEVDSKYA